MIKSKKVRKNCQVAIIVFTLYSFERQLTYVAQLVRPWAWVLFCPSAQLHLATFNLGSNPNMADVKCARSKARRARLWAATRWRSCSKLPCAHDYGKVGVKVERHKISHFQISTESRALCIGTTTSINHYTRNCSGVSKACVSKACPATSKACGSETLMISARLFIEYIIALRV